MPSSPRGRVTSASTRASSSCQKARRVRRHTFSTTWLVTNAAVYHRLFDPPKAGIGWRDSVQNSIEVLRQGHGSRCASLPGRCSDGAGGRRQLGAAEGNSQRSKSGDVAVVSWMAAMASLFYVLTICNLPKRQFAIGTRCLPSISAHTKRNTPGGSLSLRLLPFGVLWVWGQNEIGGVSKRTTG